MEPRIITQYQNIAEMGMFHPLTCKNDSSHPPLVADVDKPNLSIRCVFCSYTREVGLHEYSRIKDLIELAKEIYVKQEEKKL